MKKRPVIVIFVIFLAVATFFVVTHPSNDREWVADNEVLATATINDGQVAVQNVRNFSYRSPYDFDEQYYDETYDLSKIKSVDFINVPFSGVAAHTFLSFGFDDGKYVAVSIEARREEGEEYGIFKGLARQFELMYVVADERDVLKLRTNYREENDVYLYPIKISEQKARELFVDVMNRVDKLSQQPEIYNTVTNNCTTNIVDHVNAIATDDAKIGFSLRYILPKFSDRLAYDLGLIDAEGTFDEVKERFYVTGAALEHADAEDFSIQIREELGIL
jgi:hypothetical protein